MQTKIASLTILAHLKNASDDVAVSMEQIKLWLGPQKAEHDCEYDINQNYFEMLMRQTLSNMLEQDTSSLLCTTASRMEMHVRFH